MQPTRTRVLIIGGGFGGTYTAMMLEKLLKGDPSVEVGLISKENYLVFQPMLPEVISGSIGIVDTIAPIRRLCPKTNLVTREVESIDLKNKTVTTSAGFRPRPFEVEYDHLVIALGNITSFAGQPGLAEHALPFKYLGDALVLRNHVIHALEEADVESDRELRRALLTFVVAGGGFSGVEAVAELNDFVRAIARGFRRIDPREIRVVLLHAGPLILPELPQSLAQFSQRLLQRRGVEIRLNTRLAGATSESALLEGDERIPTKTLVSTVPAAPNPLVAALPCKKERGRIVVNQHLEVIGYPGVWALGDCAWVVDHETWQPCPPTAQHATRQAACLAKNLFATLRGKPKQAFSFQALGKLASLGHRSAVAEVFGFKVSGFIAWLMWRAIYLMKLPGFDRKLRVSTDWFLDLLLPPDIVQLKLGKPASLSREHFEPHQIIFRQGDRGDRLYIVVDGEVEMLMEDPQHEQSLARLGPGECFGEMALVNESPRMATARTVTKANLLSLDRATFNALFASHPPLRSMFQMLIDKRLRVAPDDEQIEAGDAQTEVRDARRTQA
ncbi:MAG TPA: FAD-dependent oxidoreductase [Terriglobales bacterium]|nr:FAD-dependent oxidoreductase [Terriglobales bacterium]